MGLALAQTVMHIYCLRTTARSTPLDTARTSPLDTDAHPGPGYFLDDDKPGEECGIVAMYNLNRESDLSVTSLMPAALMDLQHRGQLAAGVTSFDPTRAMRLKTFKEVGVVHEVFRLGHPEKAMAVSRQYAGCAAIGHVRYATSGRDQQEYSQPFERTHSRPWKWFSIGFNGNLANYPELRSHLTETRGYHMVYNVDTEVLQHHVAYALRGEVKPDMVKVFTEMSQALDGAFNVVFLNAEGDLVALRDPLGFRPLCYGQKDGVFVVASESVALQNMGIEDIKDVEPGQMVWVDEKTREPRFEYYTPKRAHHHCFFEWIYFAHVTSVMEGRAVYEVRWRLGEQLGARELLEVDKDDCVVVPVPDTAKPIGLAFAFALGIPSLEGIVRNRYVGRTFIEGTDREDKVRRKYTLVKSVLRGKKVFLVEDSLVRSTTLRGLVERTREQGGAQEVHVRIGSPPVIAPCYYGIDMSTMGELYAPKHLEPGYTIEEMDRQCKEIARDLGADSVRYLPVKRLADCVGQPHEHLCTACVTGSYPTKWGQRLYTINRGMKSKPVGAAEYHRAYESEDDV